MDVWLAVFVIKLAVTSDKAVKLFYINAFLKSFHSMSYLKLNYRTKTVII